LIESPSKTAEVAEHRISADEVRDALQKLTPDQRQVILLKFMEGLSNQEVAETLSKPVGAVKSLQHRALTNLRHLLVPSEERVIA
jgi:RNA polymerase sigma-70 factor (ECF subfamily)